MCKQCSYEQEFKLGFVKAAISRAVHVLSALLYFLYELLMIVVMHVIIKPRTPLEQEVAAVLRGSAHVLERSNKELTEEEEKALLTMDLEEVGEYDKKRRMFLPKIFPCSDFF